MFPFYRDYVILDKEKKNGGCERRTEFRWIKRDATESKISKGFDYFSNKIPECLPKNKYL